MNRYTLAIKINIWRSHKCFLRFQIGENTIYNVPLVHFYLFTQFHFIILLTCYENLIYHWLLEKIIELPNLFESYCIYYNYLSIFRTIVVKLNSNREIQNWGTLSSIWFMISFSTWLAFLIAIIDQFLIKLDHNLC